MNIPLAELLDHVYLKTRWACHHLDILESSANNWDANKACSYGFYDDFKRNLHVWRFVTHLAPDAIPGSLGDFVNCLSSGLDIMAWGLAHSDTSRVFSDRQQRRIGFLIYGPDPKKLAGFHDRLKLFPAGVAVEIDALQPYHRGDPSYRDHPLWILNELWNTDKHRGLAVNSNSLGIEFPISNWRDMCGEVHFEDGLELQFPMVEAYKSPVKLEPSVTYEILFGEYMGALAIRLSGLRDIYNFVRDDVIPRFTGFLK